MLKVEQADRVLASQIVISTENAKRILAGENDDHPWVRKVAQYREDTASPLREALEWALAELEGRTVYDNESQRDNCFAKSHAALAALSPDTTGGE